jgi:hypothetical protein
MKTYQKMRGVNADFVGHLIVALKILFLLHAIVVDQWDSSILIALEIGYKLRNKRRRTQISLLIIGKPSSARFAKKLIL